MNNIAAGDFNDDGATDFVVQVTQGDLYVYLAKGDGTFATMTTIPEQTGSGAGLSVGDFNADGNEDIVVSAFAAGASIDDSVNLLLGNGDGTFQLAKNFGDLSTDLFSMHAADFNKDGKLDVLYSGQDAMGVLLNNGQGFSSPGVAVTASFPSTAIYDVADFNGDKAADIVYADSTKGACVLLNGGTGTFGAATCAAAYPSQSPTIAIAGDVDGDGKVDVVTIYDQQSGTISTPNVAVYLGKGDGTFGAPIGFMSTDEVAGALLVDTNNDKKLDIVLYSGTTVSIIPNDATGKFAGSPTFAKYGLGSGLGAAQDPIIAGDFRGNGLPGFATIDRTMPVIDVISTSCSM